MKIFLQQLQKIIKVYENYPLSKLTSFKVGGPARYFTEIDSIDNLIEVLKLTKKNNVDILIIGGGSNLLITDQGWNGLVIKLKFSEIKIEKNLVKVSADISLNYLIDQLVDKSLTGLEGLAGVPGTVGGAVVGNAGAYGHEMSQVVQKVELLDENYNFKILSTDKLNFSYRHSIFKEKKYILLNIYLNLAKGEKTTIKALVDEHRNDRATKHPQCPSAGCTFKNIILDKDLEKKLNVLGMDLPEKFKEYKKVPVAWLLEQLDLKGKQIGGAQISTQHANFIINKDKATASDIACLISYVKQQVRDKVGVQLQEEVRYIGFDS